MRQKGWRRGMMHSDLARMRRDLKALDVLAVQLSREVDEAHDAGIVSLRSGVRSVPPKGASASDATGTSATSYEFRRLQSAGTYVANRVSRATKATGQAHKALEDAIKAIHNAWLDTDPDLGPDRRADHRAAREG